MMAITESKHLSSLDIAELTNKNHGDILRAIRKMEASWEKVTESKFALSEYEDASGRKLPMYILSKRESLYIATKFNDEARAKLIIRWEELEKQQNPLENPLSDIESLMEHTKRPVQLESSKKINGHLIRNWDVETAIRYNREHMLMVTGKEPSQIKKLGKAVGLKSSQRTSGKEVLRHIQPELAAQMSIDDYLVEHGKRLVAAFKLTAPCVPLLGELIELKRLKV